MDLKQCEHVVKRAAAVQSPGQFKTAYDAGYDCGLNGANIENSHFRYFGSRESADEHSRGVRDAKAK